MKQAFEALVEEFKSRTLGESPRTQWPFTNEERKKRRGRRQAEMNDGEDHEGDGVSGYNDGESGCDDKDDDESGEEEDDMV